MSIRVQCPNPDCGATHKVKDRYAGKRCLCPSCGKAFGVPEQPAVPVPPAPNVPETSSSPVAPLPAAPAPTSPAAATPAPAPVPLAAPVAPPMPAAGAGRIPVATPVTAPVRGPVPLAAPVTPRTTEPAPPAPALKVPMMELAPKKAKPPAPKVEADDDLAAFLDAVREEEAVRAEVVEDEDVADAVLLEEAEEDNVNRRGRDGRENGRVAPEAEEDDLAVFVNAVEEEKKPAVVEKDEDGDEVEEAILADEIEEAGLAEDEEEVVEAELSEEEEPIDAEVVEEDEADEKPPARNQRAKIQDTENDEENEEDDVEEAKVSPPQAHFSWMAVVFLLLGTLAVYALIAVPFVGGTSKITAAGHWAKVKQTGQKNPPPNDAAAPPPSKTTVGHLQEGQELPPNDATRGFGPLPSDLQSVLWGAPAAIGTVALLGLLVAIFTRRFDGFTLVLLYLATLLTAAYLLVAGWRYEAHLNHFAFMKQTIHSNHPDAGELTLHLAPHLWLGLLASAAALLLLGAGILFMHRRVWSRLVFLLLFLAVAGGALYTALKVKIDTFAV